MGGRLDFHRPSLSIGEEAAASSYRDHRGLQLAFDALDAGGTAPATLNAANEVAVSAFLAGRIRFTDIAAICAATLARMPARALTMLGDALAADAEARRVAGDAVAARSITGTVTA